MCGFGNAEMAGGGLESTALDCDLHASITLRAQDEGGAADGQAHHFDPSGWCNWARARTRFQDDDR